VKQLIFGPVKLLFSGQYFFCNGDNMYYSSLATLGFCAASVVGASTASHLQARDVLDDLQNQAIQALRNASTNGVQERSCSIFSASSRKDW
jgi:hypothetical protein